MLHASRLRILCSLGMIIATLSPLHAADPLQEAGAETFLYRKTPQTDLNLFVLKPKDAPGRRPAILFFFPGGWRVGKVQTFLPQAEAMRKAGWVAILADYRVAKRHQTEPRDAVEDAIACYEWVLQNAAKLGIDPAKFVVAGGSSGGHLAACVGLFESKDSRLVPRTERPPSALVLFNPVLDVVKYGGDRTEKILISDPQSISPVHQLHKGLPPTLVLHGTADKVVPVEVAERFTQEAKKLGLDVTLLTYPEKVHGFYNAEKDEDGHTSSLRDMRSFLEQKFGTP